APRGSARSLPPCPLGEAATEALMRQSIELAPRSISPEPARRSSGDLAERSSLCATPFRMTKLAPSSVKSVRSAAIAPCSAGGLDPRRDLALRSNSARLTPFRLESRSARLAPPESAFFIALTFDAINRSIFRSPFRSSAFSAERSIASSGFVEGALAPFGAPAAGFGGGGGR